MKALLVVRETDPQGEIVGILDCIDVPETGELRVYAAQILKALLDDRERLLDEIASETKRANNLVASLEQAHQLIALLEEKMGPKA